MNRLLILSFTLLSFFVVACEGPVGPEGPQGPQGDQGLQGDQGPIGNANVQVELFSFSRDTVAVANDSAGVAFDVAAITQAVYDGGSVEVFYERDDTWVALPLSEKGSFETVEFTYAYSPGKLFLIFTSSDSFLDRSSIPDGRVKAVIIPPAAASKSGVSSREYDAKRYEGTLRSLGLM